MIVDQHHDCLKSTEGLQKNLTIYPDLHCRSEMNVKLPNQGLDIKWPMEAARTGPAELLLINGVGELVLTVLAIQCNQSLKK